jgi:CheY-like chemotaxis protein
MSGRHVALLVEDEPEMAEEIKELLTSLGHDFVHVSTQKEALAFVEQGGRFCYVLLDLQIKVDEDSIRARVEAGQTLLEILRKRFSERNAHDELCVPILVMSGHAKEHSYVVRAFQAGASDFLRKPFSENESPVGARIREALRRSGREAHERCSGAPEPKRPTPGTILFAITGRVAKKKRTEVRINGESVAVTTVSFLMLLRLAVARLRSREEWVHKRELGATDIYGWKTPTRLQEEIVSFLPEGMKLIENDGHGRYKLHRDVELESVDTEVLERHADGRVKKLAGEVRDLVAKGTSTATQPPHARRGGA